MRLKPKKIGEDLTLDEYNALQYLLYQITLKDTIMLKTYENYKGKYAEYKLTKNDQLHPNDKNDDIRINKDVTNNDKIQIQIKNTKFTTLNINKYITAEATLYYKPPNTEPTEDDTDYDYQPTDYKDLKQWSNDESHPVKTLEDYNTIKLPATISGNIIQIPLIHNGTPLPKTTLINKQIIIEYKFNEKPRIDIDNGIAPNLNEILLDTPQELQRMVKFAPNDGETITYIRLNSQNQYKLTDTITIKNGQHIQILGGTITKATIDGTDAKRSFIVKPGATLDLERLNLINNDATQTPYEKGLGGAVLVEYDKSTNKYGKLIMNSCSATNNKARSGGVVFAQHACVTLNNSTFKNNTATMEGGAVTYKALAVRQKFNSIRDLPGTKVILRIDVLDYSDNPLTEGFLQVYGVIDGEEQQYLLRYKGSTSVGVKKIELNGTQIEVPLEIPLDIEGMSIDIRSEYTGTEYIDNDVDYTKIYVRKIRKYTAKLANTNITAKNGTLVTLKALVYDANNDISTDEDGVFLFNQKTIVAQRVNNAYMATTYIDKLNDGEYPYDFFLVGTDVECKTVRGKITVTSKPTNILNTTTQITGLYVTKSIENISELRNLVSKGITDVFWKVDYARDVVALQDMMEPLKGEPIRFHAYISVFKAPNSQYFTVNTSQVEQVQNLMHQLFASTSISGVVFDNLRYSGVNNDANENIIKTHMKTLYDYVKDSGDYTASATVQPELNTSKKYGQTVQNTAAQFDYTIPLLFNGDVNAKVEWIGNTLKTLQAAVGNKKLLPMIQSYESYSKQNKQDVSVVNAKIKQVADNNSIGVIIARHDLLSAYPKPFNQY